MLPVPGQENTWPPHSMWHPVAAVLVIWDSMEGWEDVDGSLVSIESTLQAVGEQLLETVRSPASRVGWIFLAALRSVQEEAHTEKASIRACSPERKH